MPSAPFGDPNFRNLILTDRLEPDRDTEWKTVRNRIITEASRKSREFKDW
jgi:hypothetical protein